MASKHKLEPPVVGTKRPRHDEEKVEYPYLASTMEEAAEILLREGVVVVPNVIKGVDEYRSKLLEELNTAFPDGKIGAGLNHYSKLPPQTRAGMFQSLVGNLPTVWTLRSHPRVSALFRGLYASVRGTSVEKLGQMVTSIDGISVAPAPKVPAPVDFVWSKKHPDSVSPHGDWPHTDQCVGSFTKYIQGQVVLADTTASFVCSPRSHLHYDGICGMLGVKPTASTGEKWVRVKEPSDMDRVASFLETKGGRWQVPIRAPKGSMILWFSLTMHSARAPEFGDRRDRTVVFICHRPLSDVDQKLKKCHVARLQKAWKENRMTNHTGARLFGKRPGGRFAASKKYDVVLESWIQEPAKLWKDRPELQPKLTPEIRSLLGY